VQTPATITLECRVDGAAIRCNWSAGPDGTHHYRVLRGEAGSTGPGRVWDSIPAGTTVWFDPSALPGGTFLYVVQALDAGGAVLAHSNMASVSWQ
jgi:hypothetical protein